MKMKRISLMVSTLLAVGLLTAGGTSSVLASTYTEAEIQAENTDGDQDYISNDETFFSIPTVDPSVDALYDYADLLTDSEEAELLQRQVEIENSKNCDIIILTLSENEIPYDYYDGTDTTKSYAEQFYIDSGFRNDAVVFTVDMNNRVIWTVGHGTYDTSDFVDFTEEVYNAALSKARQNDYYGEVDVFLTKFNAYKNPLLAMVPTAMSLVISLVIAILTAVIFLSKHKSAQALKFTPQAAKAEYYQSDVHDVRFMGTRRHVRHIPPPSKSSGGGGGFSGGHSSGGGFSGGGGGFSGGGGKF